MAVVHGTERAFESDGADAAILAASEAASRRRAVHAMVSEHEKARRAELLEEANRATPCVHTATGSSSRADFFSQSSTAAGLLADARASGDHDALTAALKVCAHVWAKWKLQPAALPALRPGEPYRVLREEGVTLIDIECGKCSSGVELPELRFV